MQSSPLFIIGMPRSGTKLLRDLLNNSEHISIPIYETGFIPNFINKYGLYPNFDDNSISEIINDFKNSTFYFKKDGLVFDEYQFKHHINYNSLLSIIKYLLQYFAETRGEGILWGDKTPHYINHIDLLNTSFSGSKFIHIIIDPRDNVVSSYKAWNKNIYRVAYHWNKSITNFKNYINSNEI